MRVRHAFIIILFLLYTGIASAVVPYFPVSYYPTDPSSGDTVEVTVQNYNDIAFNAEFQWYRDGSLVRDVNSAFQSGIARDAYTVTSGNWEVVVIAYDFYNQMINSTRVSFSVPGEVSTPVQTPAPTPTPIPPPPPFGEPAPEPENITVESPAQAEEGGSSQIIQTPINETLPVNESIPELSESPQQNNTAHQEIPEKSEEKPSTTPEKVKTPEKTPEQLQEEKERSVTPTPSETPQPEPKRVPIGIIPAFIAVVLAFLVRRR